MMPMTHFRLIPSACGLLFLLIAFCLRDAHAGESLNFLRSNDVICFVGGANVVDAQHYGYLETLLRISFPDSSLKFRSLAHEGDTVYEQPRDYNYPDLEKQLKQCNATLVLGQFGQMEFLDATNRSAQFISSCDKLLNRLVQNGRRVTLISPAPFERPRAQPRLPDLTTRNEELRRWVNEMKTLAAERNIGFVDLFSQPKNKDQTQQLTRNGVHLNPEGHWNYDVIIAQALGAKVRSSDANINAITGAFSRPDWEQVRQAVLAKNRLWFNYYRPMNWAFLGGDRTDQPSSRDYRDPKIRWFPEEMKAFEPLIEQVETRIAALVSKTDGAQ
jgi:hypothetical protein